MNKTMIPPTKSPSQRQATIEQDDSSLFVFSWIKYNDHIGDPKS